MVRPAQHQLPRHPDQRQPDQVDQSLSNGKEEFAAEFNPIGGFESTQINHVLIFQLLKARVCTAGALTYSRSFFEPRHFSREDLLNLDVEIDVDPRFVVKSHGFIDIFG